MSVDSSPFLLCKVLHSLLTVTLNNVIIPLRKELKRSNQSHEIITLEIQDAENKTFEYLSQLISVVCNATEDVANEILKEYPKSESCFRCLGVNDDTGQGLLRIRGIGFLQLLDMSDEEVRNILTTYNDSPEDIEHVINGLEKIRSNIDLIESSMSFDDDTRNLVKLVIRLTKENEDNDSVYPQTSNIPGNPLLSNSISALQSEHLMKTGNDNKFIENGDICRKSWDPAYPCYGLQTSSPDISFSAVHSTTPIIFSKSTDSSLRVNSSKQENCGLPAQWFSCSKPINGSQSIGHTSLTTHFPWEFDTHILNGGLSVPSTPNWNNKSVPSISAGSSLKNERFCVTPEDFMSPVQSNIMYNSYGREHHGKNIGTPPSKHRLKLPFPLHRSSSHGSNLTNRLVPNSCSQFSTQGLFDPLKSSSGMSSVLNDVPHSSENGPQLEAGPLSPRSYHKSSSTIHSCTAPKTAPLDIFGFDTQSNRKDYHPFSWGSVGRFPLDVKHPRGSIQANSGSHFDLDSILGPFVNSASGAKFVLSRNGTMHKFETESKIGNFVRGTSCAVCFNRMNFRLQHCVHCKIKVHRGCLPQTRELNCVPHGQSVEGSDSKGSPKMAHKIHVHTQAGSNQSGLRPTYSTPAFQGSESTSISSCTSSAPGSPFGVGASFVNAPQHSQVEGLTSLPPSLHSPSYSAVVSNMAASGSSRLASPVSAHPCGASTSRVHSPHLGAHVCNKFEFPVVTQSSKESVPQSTTTTQNETYSGPLVGTQSSAESELTMVDSLLRRFDSVDSQDDAGNLVRANSISVTLKDWDIPMEHLVIKDVIGHGTFGTVHRAKWHGEVAVKFIDLDPEDEDGSARLESFKREVALLHKTRHENLVLFMGACMKPPDLAIVTQLSQGETLYQLLHQRDAGIPINRTINIAIQIAKGMGYLHAKGIVHRDLKTRNIFVEPNSRVVIGDFGVFNCVRLYKKAKWGDYLNVPPFWLCYVAPEIIRSLSSNCSLAGAPGELPFSFSTDIFAFGTVWYELLTNEFPYKGNSAESVIYLCGRGVKPNLRVLGPKDFKEILAQCWAYNPRSRPKFTELVRKLDRLPKLHRSPSYPVKPTTSFISGSHDTLFV